MTLYSIAASFSSGLCSGSGYGSGSGYVSCSWSGYGSFAVCAALHSCPCDFGNASDVIVWIVYM